MYINRMFYIGDEAPEGEDRAAPQQREDSRRDVSAESRTYNSSHGRVASIDARTLPDNHRDAEGGWLTRLVTYQCGCGPTWLVRALGLATPMLLCWLLLVVLLGADALPGGGLFKLLSLVLLAWLTGELTQLARLPSILGMLIAGIFMATTDFYEASGIYTTIATHLRDMSLAVILLKAGLGLDPVALRKLSGTVLSLAVCPGLMEALAVALMTHYFLDYPWLWGLALGFLLCAISPAVVVPTLLQLKQQGYGEGKGISTLVIAASSIDDVLAISVFSICISIIFSTGESVVLQALQGPLDVCAGLTAGALFGLLAAFTPHLEDECLVWKRVVLVGGGGLCAVLGSPSLGLPGAGPLACVTAACTASAAWHLQGWPVDNSPVDEVFSGLWALMEPVLFGLIGAEIDLKELQLEVVSWGVLIIFSALLIRVVTCSLVLVGGQLNFKEVVFVNLAWLPKATVQAALAPQALDMVRKMSDPSAADLQRGEEVLTVAVLSILITAPLGAVGASLAGPRLLAKVPPSSTTPPHDREEHHF